jgi:hypothetical protein
MAEFLSKGATPRREIMEDFRNNAAVCAAKVQAFQRQIGGLPAKKG